MTDTLREELDVWYDGLQTLYPGDTYWSLYPDELVSLIKEREEAAKAEGRKEMAEAVKMLDVPERIREDKNLPIDFKGGYSGGLAYVHDNVDIILTNLNKDL